jgi:hypothetical protein
MNDVDAASALIAGELKAVLDLTKAAPAFAKLTAGELLLARLKALTMLASETIGGETRRRRPSR